LRRGRKVSEFVQNGDVVVTPAAMGDLAQIGLKRFDDFMNYAGGDRVCHKRGRSVVRLQVGEKAYYLKRNRLHPVEFIKALLRLRWPPRSARQEWRNLQALHQSGIPTIIPAAFGERVRFGIETESFTVTEELYGAEPVDVIVTREFMAPRSLTSVRRKRDLIRQIASLARVFHGHGMNHQDFYLNHFFLRSDGRLFLLDLQRVQCRRNVPMRSLVKDLAQLNYSTRVYGGFTDTDRIRFFKSYLETMKLGARDRRLLYRIIAKTERIAKHDVKLMQRRRRRGELPQL